MDLKLLQDPGIRYPIDDLSLNFQDYIQQSKEIIAKARLNSTQAIVEANAPFEFQPKEKTRYGALLIHGLLDSGFIMRDLGHFLQAQGILARSILLPGHGTVPGGLLNVRYQDWQQAVRYGVAALKSDVEKIILVGFSLGGILAIDYAAIDPAISSVITLAPVFKINSPIDFTANWHRLFSWKFERAKWLYTDEEIDYVKYRSIAYNAIYQTYLLAKRVRETSLSCPLFCASSVDDTIISNEAVLRYFQRQSNAKNRALIYSNKKITFADQRISLRHSDYPDLGIENFSHIALPVMPTNPHYGEQGDYPLASHPDRMHFVYGEEDKLDAWYYQLRRHLKLSELQHGRLTFNPDFDFMINSIRDFILN